MTFTLVDTKPWKASVRPWISSIQEGLVAEWNANMPELSVGPHDRIISVNSKGGSPAELADMLAAADDVVELEVLHYNLWKLVKEGFPSCRIRENIAKGNLLI